MSELPQLVVPCFTDGPDDRLVISDDMNRQELRTLRAQMVEKDVTTSIHIEEAQARELFIWLGKWLHR